MIHGCIFAAGLHALVQVQVCREMKFQGPGTEGRGCHTPGFFLSSLLSHLFSSFIKSFFSSEGFPTHSGL